MDTAINKLVPEEWNSDFIHTKEGPDDMPAHVKNSLIGISVNIPINNGNLLLGQWQDIYIFEHRYNKINRNIILTSF